MVIWTIDENKVFCYSIAINQWQMEGGNKMEIAAIVWFVLLLVFLVVEASCPIHLVSIWFAAGAFVAMIASYLGAALWLQILLFLAVSAVAMAALRPIVRKYIHPKLTATNVDSVIGSVGLVTAAIDNVSATGQVKLGAMEWSARSTSGEPIPVGTQVRVDRIEGVKVFVTPVKVPEKV